MNAPFAPRPVTDALWVAEGPTPAPAAASPAPEPAASDPAAALALMQRRLDRERAARKAAEALLTDKSRELWDALQCARDTERRLQLALWANDEGTWEWHPADDRLAVAGLIVDGRPETLSADTLTALLADLDIDDRLAAAEALQRHRCGEQPHVALDLRLPVGGARRWLRLRGRALSRDDAGRAVLVSGTIRDVTTQREDEHLRTLLAHAFASTLEALVVVGHDWCIRQTNATFATLAGQPSSELVGAALDGMVGFAAGLYQPAPWRGEALLRVGGPERALEVAITRIDPQPGQAECYLVALNDISERRHAEQALQRLALSDGLTGLANRMAINQHLAQRMAPRVDGADIAPFQLLFIDLDGFKNVNDSYGHRAGDALLCETADRLRAALPQAFIGRWGGDEFVVVLEDRGGDYAVREGAQVVIATLAQPFRIEGHRMSVSPSIGAVQFPADGDDAATLLQRADAAMYAAKARGRNGLVIYDPTLDEGTQRHSRLRTLVRADAERNAFHFAVQPQVDAAGRTVGAEMLMRWNAPHYGAVSPAEFIPIAEQIGVIDLMGRHALHSAARLALQLRDLGSPVTIAVNLSPRQLLRTDLERTVLHACEYHHIDPGRIELELTESALVHDIAQVERLMGRLRRHGFRLALDDFGTGYSSLSHLRRLPFHQVKIDRSFVIDLVGSPRSQVMLEGIVRLCRSLGLETVAEGVETQDQFTLLRDLGVGVFQGYLFARPMPPEAWLERVAAVAGIAAAPAATDSLSPTPASNS